MSHSETSAAAARRIRETIQQSRSKCPLCESGELEYEFVVDKSPVCRCRDCGLLFLNPAPARTAAEQGAGVVPLDSAVLDSLYRKNAEERLRDLIAYAGGSCGRLLLVGADTHMASQAEHSGFAVTAISPKDLDVTVFDGEEPFDAALLFCALEQSADPLAALSWLRQSLKPGGALMVISPTVDTTAARLFKHNWWEFNRDNLFYFSTDTLQALLSKAGFVEPLVNQDRSLISLNYARRRMAGVKRMPARLRWLRTAFSLSPFLRNKQFRSIHGRTRFLVRAGETRKQRPSLSVIVPVFNEKATCTELLDGLLAKTIDGVDMEVIIVESNSTDGSRELVLPYGENPRVKLILEPKPMGKGHAVRTALEAASGDIVLFQDADLEYDLNDYEGLLIPLLRYQQNFVLGSRHTRSNTSWKIRNFVDAPGLAAIFNFGHLLFLTIFNTLYGQKLSDPFTMFKVFRRECLYGLAFECNRFDFDYEIVIKLLRKGYVPRELPVNYTSRSVADGKKVTMFRDPITWIQAMLKFRRSPLYGSKVERS